MHFCTFVIIGKNTDSASAVNAALAPFDENMDVTPYRRYLDAHETQDMAEHYHLSVHDLPALAAKMHDWRGVDGGIDGDRLYALSTYNPNGRWDWYEIGGRWDRYVPGSRRNVIGAGTLLKGRRLRTSIPYQLVTPDGEWLEREDNPWFSPASEAERTHEAHWFARVRDTLARYRDHKVVCVDIHS